MSNKNNNNNKHLTLSQRILIEKGLEQHESFSMIAKKTGKDPSTISKEVRRHLIYHIKQDGDRDIPCMNRSNCTIRFMCNENCIKICKTCAKANFHCTSICSEYKVTECQKLKKPPYVCNGCLKKTNCLLKKSILFC